MKIREDFIGISTPFYCNDGKGNFYFTKGVKVAEMRVGIGILVQENWILVLFLKKTYCRKLLKNMGVEGKFKSDSWPTIFFGKIMALRLIG